MQGTNVLKGGDSHPRAPLPCIAALSELYPKVAQLLDANKKYAITATIDLGRAMRQQVSTWCEFDYLLEPHLVHRIDKTSVRGVQLNDLSRIVCVREVLVFRMAGDRLDPAREWKMVNDRVNYRYA
jgi:hypothetical protein